MKKGLLALSACITSCLLLAGSAQTKESDVPVVYFTSDISADGLVRIYDALGWTPEGAAAVKISTGEPPASNYLHPELIGDLVKKVNGTIRADRFPVRPVSYRLQSLRSGRPMR